MVFALVDCNNFYVSCERIFRPALENKAVVVLSNNDGCIIARSEEAKESGVRMGVPAFEIRELIEKNNIHVFSSNYTLYGDISQRVMTILAQLSPDLEIYSIDEAFLRIDGIWQYSPAGYAERIRSIIASWVGIPVSIGLGPTKTLAKAANFLAKTDTTAGGIFDLTDKAKVERVLSRIPAGKVWGIGEQYEKLLENHGIRTAADLRMAPEIWVRKEMSITGLRTLKELNGISCIPLEDAAPAKNNICISRSYGRHLEHYEDVEQATAEFVARVAGKLRKQGLAATQWTVFLMTNRFARGPRYVNFKTVVIPSPTNDTITLNKITVKLLKSLFRPGYRYKKSGVMAENLIPAGSVQTALWDNTDTEKHKSLMQTVDKINQSLGRDTVKFALQGWERRWKMRQEKLSPHYTTKWSDILKIEMD